MNTGDRRECKALQAQIEHRIELAEKAHAEGRLSEADEHIEAAVEIYRALRRLEKVIWHSALTELREAGVVLGNGGSA